MSNIIQLFSKRTRNKLSCSEHINMIPFPESIQSSTTVYLCMVFFLLKTSLENEEWVLNQIIDILESDEIGYKLCIHNRDFVPGFTIMKNICTAIEHSRRLIAVVTR